MKAYSFIEEAALANALNAARGFGGKAIQKAAQSPIATGAVVGTGVGAMKGALKKDQNGQRHLITGALKGGTKGAVVGTAAGAAVKGGNALTRKMTGGTDMLKNAANFGQKQQGIANKFAKGAAKAAGNAATK